MIKLTRSHVQPIGVDIGFDSIKMLQLETVGQSLSVIGAARQPLPDDVRAQPHLRMPLAMDTIRQMLRDRTFSGRRIVAALPREMIHLKNLRLPIIPAHELESAIRYEVRSVFPFDTERAHMQFMVAGEVRQATDVRQEVIVMVARHEDVDNFIEQLHRCGAEVDSLDAEPCALYRHVERFIRRREDEQEVHVIVDVGARRTQVVIGRGRDISFTKPVEIGSQHLLEPVSVKLGISIDEARALRRRLNNNPDTMESARRDPVRQAVFDATRSVMEELGREISLCLRYFSVTFRGQRPNKVRIVGGEACDPQLQFVLNQALTIPVEPGRPLFSVDTSRMKPNDRRGLLCEWALALGLGLRLTRGNFGPRDGKPRDPFAPVTTAPANAPAAQVVDLNEAVKAPEKAPEPSPARRQTTAAPNVPGKQREEAHAGA